MAFPLTAEQRAASSHRGSGLLVAAAAGSGKTRVLVERLLDRVTEEGEDITRFLVITYTKAAAAELRGRIAQEISTRLAERPTDRHLRRQATEVYRAQISTIHAFCALLLRENGSRVGLDPDFRLMDEGEATDMMARVLGDVMDSQYEHMTEDFQTLVDTMSAGRDDSRLEQIVLDIFGRIQSHPHPHSWLKEQCALWSVEEERVDDTLWGQILLAYGREQTAYCKGELERAIALASTDAKLAENYVGTLSTSLRETEHLLAGLETGWDEAVAALPVTFPLAGRKKGVEDEGALTAVKSIRTRCKGQLDDLKELFDSDSATQLDDLRLAAPAVVALMGLVEQFSLRYSQEKGRRSVMDFSDLEHYAVSLLVDEGGNPTPLAHQWSGRFCEVMVDEYQDTNEVQNAIFDAISMGGERLFMVGDVKQSIYRFRLADPTIFLGKLERFPKQEVAAAGESCAVVLGQNFRSRPQVLEGCNDFFQAVMTRQFGEMNYDADHFLYPGASFPQGEGYQVELTALDLGFMTAQEREEKNRYEGRWAAQCIRQLLDSGFQVSQGDTTRNLEPSDIMILLRSPNAVQHHYMGALDEAGIPWAASGGGDFFESTEIRVALSLLRVVDNIRQDVPLIALLRSPIYGFSGDKLAEIRGAGTGDFYTALLQHAQDGDEDCRRVVDELTDLRFGAVDRSCSQLIWHLYEETNLLGLFSAMEGGDSRRGNLLTLHSLATSLEGAGCRTLFQFLLRIQRMQETGGKIAAPAPQGEGVTIMSIHRSKGLEKPVVLLCGLSRRLNKMDLYNPVLFHPKLGVGPRGLDVERMVEYPTIARRGVALELEREMLGEELRLLYVAMTRAREKLILCVPLMDGCRTLERLGESATLPPSPVTLAGQQTVGSWLLLHAMTREEGGALRLQPGIPFDEPSPYPWRIQVEEGSHLRRPLTARRGEVERDAQQMELPDYSWRYPYEAAIDIPSKLTATQLKREQVERLEEPPLERPTFVAKRRGLTAAQRGTAIHLAIQYLPLDTPPQETEGVVRQLVEEGFLTPLQGEAIPPQLLTHFLTSPLAQRMRGAHTLQREFPFSVLLPAQMYDPAAPEGETVMLQGVVDCWFEDGDGITIVDFKSDHVTEDSILARSEGYRLQLVAYRHALEEILGKKATRSVLWFLSLGRSVEMELDEDEKIIK